MQRQTRSMERLNSMRGKRPLDNGGGGGGDDDQPEQKRPALASVIVEALKVDNLQKLCSSLEPILRRVVSEELERALARIGPTRVAGRASPKRIEGFDGRNLQLHFRSKLSLPLFTGGKVEGEQGAAIHVVLIDANSGHVVTSGPESSIKLDIVVLEGDFNNEDDEDWSQEVFESHVVKEREGKRPLLTGDLQVTLKEGVGTLGELTFTDNSSWIRSRKFRLGLKVASGYCEGIRVREAKTEAFNVKDHRGELYKKHYPPALYDDVWRLEKIGKDGSFHKRLSNNGINIVEDFLRLAVKDSQKLRTILGSGMSNRMWDALMEHAKTCVLSGKLYVYYSDDARNVGVVFNNIYELTGLIARGQYFSADSLSDSQKVYVDTLLKKAYENWHQVIEYDGKALVNSKQTRRTRSSQNDLSMSAISYPNAIDDQMAFPQLHTTGSTEHALAENSITPLGYNDNMVNKFSNQTHPMNSSSHNQFENTLFSQHALIGGNGSEQSQITESNNRAGLSLGPSQPSASGFPIMQSSQPSSINAYDDWSQGQISEEDIRNRSHELLESDDMQQLLRLMSMGGHMNMPDETFQSYPTFMPTPSNYNSFEEDRSRPGKAVVGWLKIKAAMRWGFFIRKKAAERRRAQLVELDD
ncbi:calmodulin-binding protein 60 B-like [Amaranthus tricolor]|uniref:calmodulin-binding protein 60 B-like n=1 Tax=Amaranthus tricolor TaxID=29722 RepID=UPI00258DBF8A|nr:calmodulin-binding protein 60 B-like [Amaranthus tricolor]XP_057545529.1 calmodulin-binding protein 60 B-like [Amaranthus tricolor]